MADRLDLIARIGAAIDRASDDATKTLLRESLAALVEDHGLLQLTERRRAKDRQRKRQASDDSMESAESVESMEGAEIQRPSPPAPSPSFPTPHITPSSPPSPASSSSATRDSSAIEAEHRLLDRTATAALGKSRPVLMRFLDHAEGAQRTAWVGRLTALLDLPPHFTPDELVEGVEALMTEPRDNWKPAVLKAWVRRVRSDAEREAERTSEGPAESVVARSSRRAGEDDAGRVFAEIRKLVQTGPAVPGQTRRQFIRRADVEALGERALLAYERVGGADRFLDSTEAVGFLLRDFRREYIASAAAVPPSSSTRVLA